MLNTINFLKTHLNTWRDILSSPPYNLIIKDGINGYEGLVLLKYNQFDSDFSLPIVRECRGIIIDIEDNFNPICHPFNKFFNYGEKYADSIDWKSARVQEKVDGSIIKFWKWNRKNRWVISTNGAINAFDANISSFSDLENTNGISFGELFLNALYAHFPNENTMEDMGFNPNYTYMFELVSPLTQVVVKYPNTDIYHIGTRDNITGEELDIDIGIKKPKAYPLHSLSAVVEAAEHLNANGNAVEEEGFVVVDKNWNRIKVKSPLYLQSHYLKGNIPTIGRCIDIYLANEAEEYLTYFPEQKETFDKIFAVIDKLETLLDNGWLYIKTCYGDVDKKELSEIISGKKGEIKLEWGAYYFKKLDNPEITPNQFLFGGKKYFNAKTNEWKVTPPLNRIKDKLKYYFDNYDKETIWRF